MPKRRKVPPEKAKKFIQGLLDAPVLSAKTKGQAIRDAGAELYGCRGPFSPETRADALLREPEVGMMMLKWLRRYQATWVQLEEAARGVLARHMSGYEVTVDPVTGANIETPIAGLDPYQIECLRKDAAMAVLRALAKIDPTAFSARAREEDQARKTLPELARAIVGDETPEYQEPPTAAPGPDDGKVS